MKKDLTIIVLAYNSAGIIKDSLKKLDSKKYEIIAVDNASKDASAKIIKENFPQIKLIKLKQNIGYGRANNVALKQVKTDFALVLNPDTILQESSIEKILKILKKDNKIALAGPIVYHGKLENGKIIDEVLVKKANDKSVLEENNDFYLTKFITGAAMFMNIKIMKKLGFFDEGFFLYGEDNEICKRTAKKGFKNVIVKNTKLVHLSGRSSVVNEKELEKIFWHKFGWSKCYYTECVHNVVIAKLKAIRMILKALILMLRDILNNRPIAISTKGMWRGSLAYLIGLKAFKEDGSVRG